MPEERRAKRDYQISIIGTQLEVWALTGEGVNRKKKKLVSTPCSRDLPSGVRRGTVAERPANFPNPLILLCSPQALYSSTFPSQDMGPLPIPRSLGIGKPEVYFVVVGPLQGSFLIEQSVRDKMRDGLATLNNIQ